MIEVLNELVNHRQVLLIGIWYGYPFTIISIILFFINSDMVWLFDYDYFDYFIFYKIFSYEKRTGNHWKSKYYFYDRIHFHC